MINYKIIIDNFMSQISYNFPFLNARVMSYCPFFVTDLWCAFIVWDLPKPLFVMRGCGALSTVNGDVGYSQSTLEYRVDRKIGKSDIQ